MPAPGMIGVAVADDSPVDSAAHRVEIEIPRRALQALWRWLKQEVRAEHALNVAGRRGQGRAFSALFVPDKVLVVLSGVS